MANCGDSGDTLNTSDFFNSKCELQLSGLSQFNSDSDDTLNTNHSSVSDNSTSHEELLITPDNNTHNTARHDKDEGQEAGAEQADDADPAEGRSASTSADFSITELVEKHSTSGGEKRATPTPTSTEKLLAQLTSDNFQGFVHTLPKHLNPANRFSFSPSSSSSPHAHARTQRPAFQQPQRPFGQLPSLSLLHNQPPPQRAPNFRTHKSHQSESKEVPCCSRNMSDADIQNEAKKIYEADRAEMEGQAQVQVQKSPASPSSVVRNLFSAPPPTNITSPAQLSQSQLAVPSQRKVTLDDGLDELMNYYMHKYKQQPAPKTTNPSPVGPSPVPVDEPKVLKSKGYVLDESSSRQSKNKVLSPLAKSPKSRAINLKELDQLWKDIQDTKAKMDADIQNRLQQTDASMAPLLLEASKDSAKVAAAAATVDSISGKGKGRQPRRRRQGKKMLKKPVNTANANAGSGPSIKMPDSSNSKSEFSTLLEMTQLDESQLLDDLLLDEMNDLDFLEFEDYSAAAGGEDKEQGHVEDAEDEPDQEVEGGEDEELHAALENVQLRDWLRSDPQHVAYYEQYCQERYKRQYCEKEILDLQKQLLETKEQVAGLDGILQIKTISKNKYQKLWEGLIRKWREHESACSDKIEKLEKANSELSRTVETQLTKTKEYEVELSKTVGLVEEFKDKMQTMRSAFDSELSTWKSKMGFASVDLQNAKTEKESVAKALDEAQGCMQKLQVAAESAGSKVKEAEDQLRANAKDLARLTIEKEQVEAEVRKERQEKQVLESRLHDQFTADLSTKADQLHTYYNDKVRDILKTQSEKMLVAEQEFVEGHQLELTTSRIGHEQQLAAIRNGYETQIGKLRLNYGLELAKLKADCEEKGRVIANVSRQLAVFQPGDEPPEEKSSKKKAELDGLLNNSEIKCKNTNVTNSNSGLGQLLDSNQGMKESIASFINAYKQKHNQ